MSDKSQQPAYDPSLRPTLQPGQLGDWAAFLAIALFAVLWLSWPKVPEARGDRPAGAPAPSCSYGVLDVRSYSGTVLSHFDSGLGDEAGVPLVRMPEIELPAIPAGEKEPFPPGPPPAEDEAFRRLPGLQYALSPVRCPYEISPSPSTGVVVVVSPRLQDANFALDIPDVTNAFSLSASVLFSDPLDLPSVMIESFSGPDDILAAWREALLFSSVSSPSAGTVSASR